MVSTSCVHCGGQLSFNLADLYERLVEDGADTTEFSGSCLPAAVTTCTECSRELLVVMAFVTVDPDPERMRALGRRPQLRLIR